MNHPELEQMMLSSFSSISIVFTTGALLPEYPYKLRRFRPKKVSSTENKYTSLCFIPIAAFHELLRGNICGE
jgi:hypothetical protein